MVADENIGPKYEVLEELEDTEELESSEPKTCCRCIQNTDDSFESESCDHAVCVDCRFKEDVQCTFCATTKLDEVKTTNETGIGSLDTTSYMKKKIINKDHIVDVQKDCALKAAKQMCTVCQRVFLKSNARYHYACASGEKPLVCSECGQRFVKKSHLESHLNSHFGLKPFKCTTKKCNASFTQKDKLVRHMKTHASEKHMCEVCDKVYSSLPILQFHMQKVHTTAKLFKCDMCPRTYKYKRTLTVHQLKHQGLKEHLCETCGKKYTVAAQLKHHKCSHVPISRRPYKCQRHCKQRFITRHDKARHELIHDHTASPDYECSLCNTTFGRKDNLERHMKNFHQEEPWNSESHVHREKTVIVAPCKINKSNLKSKIAINLKKPNQSATLGSETLEICSKESSLKSDCKKVVKFKNQIKYGKKKHGVNLETCSKQKNLKNICKKRVKLKPQKQVNPCLNVHETIEPLVTINSEDKPVETEAKQVESVIFRPSVIQKVPKLLPCEVLPSGEEVMDIACNITNYTLTNTTPNLNIPNNNSTFNFTAVTMDKSPTNIQNERKPTLKVDTLNVGSRIIHQRSYLSDKNDSVNTRSVEDNSELVNNSHYKAPFNLSRRPEREVLTASIRPMSHIEDSIPQVAGSSISTFYNPCLPPHLSYNQLLINENHREHWNFEEKTDIDI